MTAKTRGFLRKWMGAVGAVCMLIPIGIAGGLLCGNAAAADSHADIDDKSGIPVTVQGSASIANTAFAMKPGANSTVPNAMALSPMSSNDSTAPAVHENSAAITADKAKQIALTHAEVSAADAAFIKIQLDREDGLQVYEVEFTSGSTEYDYNINAATGDIVSVYKDFESDLTASGNQGWNGAAITADKAKEIALKHAGVSAADAAFIKVQLDREDGLQVYEIEFTIGNTEYDYDLNAATGEIASVYKDIESDFIPDSNQGRSGDAAISIDKAKEIALKHAGVSAADAAFIKARLDWDDGLRVYEIEFFCGNAEYDYDIDAATGNILSADKEIENYSLPGNNQGSSGAAITADKAKQIALKHAGIPAANVTYIKAKLDREGGQSVYEVEFTSGRREYDYEINAATGAILSYESELAD